MKVVLGKILAFLIAHLAAPEVRVLLILNPLHWETRLIMGYTKGDERDESCSFFLRFLGLQVKLAWTDAAILEHVALHRLAVSLNEPRLHPTNCDEIER